MHDFLRDKQIMIVDDNHQIGEMIELYGQEHRLRLTYIEDSRLVLERLAIEHYDGIVLDIAMPHLDGFELYRLIVDRYSIPIIFLSARGQEQDRIAGLLLGAHDYMVKPVSLTELFIRLENIIAHYQNLVINSGQLQIDLETRLITKGGEQIRLTPRAFDVFLYLVKRSPLLCTRRQLMSEALNNEYYLDDRVIDAHVKEIRRKIGTKCVVTVRGEGYKYVKD